MYTAAVLRPDSALKLKQIMREKIDLENLGFECKTPQGEPLPHHMTLNLGLFDNTLNDPELLGSEIVLTVDSLWYCEMIGACAAKVIDSQSAKSINTQKHITICLKPPAKPFQSNKLFEPMTKQIMLDAPLTLEASIQEIQ